MIPTQFPITLTDAYDGDTLHVGLSYAAPPPFDVTLTIHRKLRLSGINCPELKTPAGIVARDFTNQWLTQHLPPYSVTFKGYDKYEGRIDGRLLAADGHCLNDDLIVSGNAVVMK